MTDHERRHASKGVASGIGRKAAKSGVGRRVKQRIGQRVSVTGDEGKAAAIKACSSIFQSTIVVIGVSLFPKVSGVRGSCAQVHRGLQGNIRISPMRSMRRVCGECVCYWTWCRTRSLLTNSFEFMGRRANHNNANVEGARPFRVPRRPTRRDISGTHANLHTSNRKWRFLCTGISAT